jgi:hypothetical protein
VGWVKTLRRQFRPLSRALRRSLRPPDYRALLKRVDNLERNAENLLRERHPEAMADSSAREFLRTMEFKVHSQNGEDGLLLHLFSKIGTTDRRLVEIGIGDGRECNAANLILNFGWSALLVDCDSSRVEAARRFYYEERGVPQERGQIAECRVTAEYVDPLLEQHGMKGPIDLLSVDIVGNDYWVWKAIQAVEPRVVVIEYNASFGDSEPLIAVYAPAFDARSKHPSGWYHGASLVALAQLAERRGYALVGCDSAGVNSFFVRQELAEGKLPQTAPAEAYYPHRRRLRHASAREQLERLRGLEFAVDP